MLDACGRKVTQHDAVVATDLDHEGVRPLQILRCHRVRQVAKMSLHVRGRGREERVIGMKQSIAVHQFGELNHAALRAQANLQIEEIFLCKLIPGQKSVGDRHLAERHERLDWSPANQTDTVRHVAISHSIWRRAPRQCSGVILSSIILRSLSSTL